jgi:hypothetical protein
MFRKNHIGKSFKIWSWNKQYFYKLQSCTAFIVQLGFLACYRSSFQNFGEGTPETSERSPATLPRNPIKDI